jgi:transposase InsO family protein
LAISISSHEFKNHIFGHAEDRYRVLPVQVNQDMRNWLEVRSLVPGSDKTDAVFTCVAKQRRSTAERFDNHPDAARLKLPTLYNILDKYSRAYLGLSLGTHFFRTLLATTVARHGTPTQVKAILNDSEEIAMKVYRDVRNADEFKALDSIYDISRKGSPQ